MASINWRRVFISGSGAGVAWSFLSLLLLILFSGEIIDAVPRPLVTASRIGGFTLRDLAGLIISSLPVLIVITMVGARSYQRNDSPDTFASPSA